MRLRRFPLFPLAKGAQLNPLEVLWTTRKCLILATIVIGPFEVYSKGIANGESLTLQRAGTASVRWR